MDEPEKTGKIKAIEVNIESLKLYITLSTFLVGGLLAYNSSLKVGFHYALIIALVLFLITAICSIISINCYIYKLDRGEIDVKAKDAKKYNIISIFSFLMGLIFTGVYFVSIVTKEAPDNVQTDFIKVENSVIIPSSAETLIKIEKDSLEKTKSIEIRIKNQQLND